MNNLSSSMTYTEVAPHSLISMVENTRELPAFEASFGRAILVDHIPAEDRETWAFGLQGEAHDHRYYDLVHDSLGDQFEHHYLLLKDHSGTTRAIQPFLIVSQDLGVGAPALARELLAKFRQLFPSTFFIRMLMVGSAAGEGHLVRDRITGDVAWVATALAEVLPSVARGLNAAMIVFKDFRKEYRSSLEPLDEAGFKRIPSMPGTRLKFDFKDFEDYLQNRLSAKMRKDLRRKFRKAETGPPITMEATNDISPHIDEIFPLYKSVYEKSKLKFEELNKSYFIALGREMGDKAVFLIWRQKGKIVAFNSCLVHEGVLRDNYIGFNYEVALDYHLYFVTRRELFSWALKNNFQSYYSAPLNYDPKLHLKQELSPLDIYARASHEWLNPFFRRLLPYLGPTRYDSLIAKFPNAADLH